MPQKSSKAGRTPAPREASRWALTIAAATLGGIGFGSFAGSVAGGALVAGFAFALGLLTGKVRRMALTVKIIEIVLLSAALFLITYYVRDYLCQPRWVPQTPDPFATIPDGSYRAAGNAAYDLVVPPSAPGPTPAVVLLHGNNGNPQEIIRDTEWDRICRERNWVLVVPQSPATTWDGDTEKTILAALCDASSRVAIDPKRILLTGRSDGATQCYAVGLRRPDVFRAIAVASGAYWPLLPLHAFRSRKVSVYIHHGGLDDIFAVAEARRCSSFLRRSGHTVLYREDRQGGHTYTPTEARRIAEWFSTLAHE